MRNASSRVKPSSKSPRYGLAWLLMAAVMPAVMPAWAAPLPLNTPLRCEAKSPRSYPCTFTIEEFDASTGRLTGRTEYPGLKATLRVVGRLQGDRLQFEETEFIGPKGRADLNCVYDLRDRGDRFEGAFKCANPGTMVIHRGGDQTDTASAKVPAVAPPAASAAGVQATAHDGDLIIEALIDGESELHITPEGLYWVSGRVSKPGRHQGRNEATYVNGTAWMPQWGRSATASGADKTAIYPLRTAVQRVLAVELLGVGPNRGATAVEKRGGITLQRQGDEAVVRIPDDVGGSAWYRFRVSFTAELGADNAPAGDRWYEGRRLTWVSSSPKGDAAVHIPDIPTNQVFKDYIPVARTSGYASVRLTSVLQAAVLGSRAANIEVDRDGWLRSAAFASAAGLALPPSLQQATPTASMTARQKFDGHARAVWAMANPPAAMVYLVGHSGPDSATSPPGLPVAGWVRVAADDASTEAEMFRLLCSAAALGHPVRIYTNAAGHLGLVYLWSR